MLPVDLEIDRMVYELELSAPDGSLMKETLEIPVARYEPKRDAATDSRATSSCSAYSGAASAPRRSTT